MAENDEFEQKITATAELSEDEEMQEEHQKMRENQFLLLPIDPDYRSEPS
ncbi:hypothetical protein [Cohnella luojiensis]|nr:hypothetical protein [Cohnella luojiensis]